jgi:hypothetical protein
MTPMLFNLLRMAKAGTTSSGDEPMEPWRLKECVPGSRERLQLIGLRQVFRARRVFRLAKAARGSIQGMVAMGRIIWPAKEHLHYTRSSSSW